MKCPYCGAESGFETLKTWKYRWYNVTLYKCGKCNNIFRYYNGVSPKGKHSEFIIRIGKRK